MSLKEKLYIECESFIDHRLKNVQNTINQIQKALLSETKSSAGDKHETGRAMLQLEREKAGQQLAEVQKTKDILSKLDPNKSSDIACLGSVIYTNKINYFIAISAGALKENKEVFYAISPNTPIAKLLLAKRKGDIIEFKGEKFIIKKIF